MGPAVGSTAPDFELANQFGEPIRLSALRGAPVVVVFYPFAFSGVCTSELGALQEDLGGFEAVGARLLAVSVDHKFTLRSYAQAQGYTFDLLADFWPHGAVAQQYGVFNQARGMAERGSFIIDADGILRHVLRSGIGEPRRLPDYHRLLGSLAA